jgi:ABC-type branched-subunit amino acid transport system substrate-binding protein
LIRKIAICLTLFATSILVNCAANPFKIPPSIKKALRESLIDNDLAIEGLEEHINEHPDSPKIALHMLHAGELRRLNNDIQIAKRWFETILEMYPTSEEKSAAMLGIAVIELDIETTIDNLDTLRIIKEEDIPDTLNADRYRILYIHHAADDAELAKIYANKARMYAQSHPITKSRIELAVGTIGPEEQTDVEEITLSEEDYLNQLEKVMSSRNWLRTIELTDLFLEKYPDSKHQLQVQAYKDRAEAEDPFEQKRIAILLPLSGKYAPAAKAIKQSLEFANTAKLEMKFYDTAWNAEKSEQENIQNIQNLIKKIVVEDGCALIIGPLLKEVAPHAAHAAQAYQIPMLSYAKSADIIHEGENIFRVSVSMDQQIDTLLNHAIDERGWKTFVAMVPENEYGKRALELFTQKAVERGGIVLRSVSYDPTTTSFLAEAKEIGLKGGSNKAPILDFDAIFIPDNHRRVPLIVSALAYEEFSIGSFLAKDHKTIYVMGLNAWNNPSIVDKGGQYLVNGIFVDAFWAGNEKESTQQFVASFQEIFGKNPNIYDALSFDVIQLVTVTLEPSSKNRADVLEHLNNANIPVPITGGAQFRANRDLDRVMDIFVIQKDGIQLWTPPE